METRLGRTVTFILNTHENPCIDRDQTGATQRGTTAELDVRMGFTGWFELVRRRHRLAAQTTTTFHRINAASQHRNLCSKGKAVGHTAHFRRAPERQRWVNFREQKWVSFDERRGSAGEGGICARRLRINPAKRPTFAASASSLRVRLRSITNTQGSPCHRLTILPSQSTSVHIPIVRCARFGALRSHVKMGTPAPNQITASPGAGIEQREGL